MVRVPEGWPGANGRGGVRMTRREGWTASYRTPLTEVIAVAVAGLVPESAADGPSGEDSRFSRTRV